MSQNKGGKQQYTKRHNNNSEGESLPRDIEKKVKQIQEMFGDWKKNEIQRCLEENNYDVQLVVQKKVEGKEDWTTVEKKEIRAQKSTRGGRSGRGARGGSRGGSRVGSSSSPSGSRSTSTTQQPASQSPTNDKPNKKKQSKQDKTTSSEVRNFSAPENEVVEEPKQTQPQQAKVLSYSEAAAAFKKKEDEEKKKVEEEKKLMEQQAKDQKEKAKIERNQQRKKKGDKKAPKEEVKEPVQEIVQQEPVVQESVVEEEVPEEELVNEEVEQQVEEQVEIQQPSQSIQQQQQPASQSNYQSSFEQRQPTQQEEQPQLQMPTGIPYSTTQNIQFGTLDLGSQALPKSQPNTSVNQPNAQTNPQMQNGQFWTDPKMHHNYGIPYIPNQYPYHPQYYPYIYQYYQPQGAQGVNTNKNFNQGFGYSQEGFGMYNQAGASEDAEQHQQDANYPFVQQPYFFMYPQGQQMQMDNKHKSESPQNEAKVNPYPAYLPGYQSQYPQSGYVDRKSVV